MCRSCMYLMYLLHVNKLLLPWSFCLWFSVFTLHWIISGSNSFQISESSSNFEENFPCVSVLIRVSQALELFLPLVGHYRVNPISALEVSSMAPAASLWACSGEFLLTWQPWCWIPLPSPIWSAPNTTNPSKSSNPSTKQQILAIRSALESHRPARVFWAAQQRIASVVYLQSSQSMEWACHN